MKARELLAALSLPLQIAERKVSTNPIVGHVKLADGKAAAYNFSMACEIAMPDANLGCCAPASRLSSALNAIASLGKDAEVKLAVKGKHLLITAPGIRYSLPTLPAAEFPVPSWPADAKPIADWRALTDTLSFAVHATNVSDQRAFCKGVAVSKAGYIGGTDSYRCAIALGESPFGDVNIFIPVDAIETLGKLPGGSAYAISETGLAVEFQGGRLFVHLLAPEFPDLARVVPQKHNEAVANVQREAFGSAAAAILKTKHKGFVRLAAAKNMIVMEDDAEADGSARIELACTYDGPDWEMGVNIRYVAEAARALGGENLTISLKEKLLLVKGNAEPRSIGIMGAKL